MMVGLGAAWMTQDRWILQETFGGCSVGLP